MWRWKVSRPSIQSWLPGMAKQVGPSYCFRAWAAAQALPHNDSGLPSSGGISRYLLLTFGNVYSLPKDLSDEEHDVGGVAQMVIAL